MIAEYCYRFSMKSYTCISCPHILLTRPVNNYYLNNDHESVWTCSCEKKNEDGDGALYIEVLKSISAILN